MNESAKAFLRINLILYRQAYTIRYNFREQLRKSLSDRQLLPTNTVTIPFQKGEYSTLSQTVHRTEGLKYPTCIHTPSYLLSVSICVSHLLRSRLTDDVAQADSRSFARIGGNL